MKAYWMSVAALLIACRAMQAADTHALSFDPRAYVNEFFTENAGTMGSCGAAAVVLVETHIPQKSTVVQTVKSKNESVKACASTYIDGAYYISSLTCLQKILNDDGYTAVNRSTTDRATAASNIFSALAAKRWVIIVSRYDFSLSGLGHFYPVYGGYKGATNASSTLNVIEDFNSSYNPAAPNWSVMYKANRNLDRILDSMKSTSGTTPPTYNILEVYDSKPPVIRVTAPGSGSTLSTGSRYTISWTSIDPSGNGDVAVDLISSTSSTCVGARSLYSIRLAGSGYVSTLQWTIPTAVTRGSYLLKVATRDVLGNWGCSTIPVGIR